MLDHADSSVSFQKGLLHFSKALDALLAKLRSQLLKRDKFFDQVRFNDSPIGHQEQRSRVDKTSKPLEAIPAQIKRVTPEAVSSNQDDPFEYRAILPRHAGLGRIGDEDHNQEVCDAQNSRLPLEHDSKQHEQAKVHDRTAQYDFQNRHARDEHFLPI